MPRMFQVLLTNIPIKISDNKICAQLSNESQKKELVEKVNPKLMKFLMENLNNYSIELKLEVLKETSTKNAIYTASDKFNYLADKNSALNIFKQSFNLDFE